MSKDSKLQLTDFQNCHNSYILYLINDTSNKMMFNHYNFDDLNNYLKNEYIKYKDNIKFYLTEIENEKLFSFKYESYNTTIIEAVIDYSINTPNKEEETIQTSWLINEFLINHQKHIDLKNTEYSISSYEFIQLKNFLLFYTYTTHNNIVTYNKSNLNNFDYFSKHTKNFDLLLNNESQKRFLDLLSKNILLSKHNTLMDFNLTLYLAQSISYYDNFDKFINEYKKKQDTSDLITTSNIEKFLLSLKFKDSPNLNIINNNKKHKL